MKYKDDLQKGFVNGQAVGIRVGSALQDAKDPNANADGYDHLRKVEHVGTVLRDADDNAYNPEPKDD